MRILCLTSRLPYPPNRGDRVRAYRFLRDLSRAHQLTLISFIAKQSEAQYLEPLRAHIHDVRVIKLSPRNSFVSVAANWWRGEPLQVQYYRSRAMRHVVDQAIAAGRFDAVYIHLFRMVPYVLDYPNLYRIVDLTDVISREIRSSIRYRSLLTRLLYLIEGPRISQYERWVAENLDETWLISEAERRALAPHCPGANIQVVNHGIDLEGFYPTGESPEPDSLIFVGHMRVFHNVDAVTHLVQDVLPLVRQRVPGCTLKIVGANPSPQVRRLEATEAVTVTGFVDDLNAELNQASLFAAPLRFAGGLQTKVLEAMASGRPVLTTSIVNQGLGAKPGKEIIIADDAQTMADRLVELLRDDNLRVQIGQAARRFVRDKHSANQALDRVNLIAQKLGLPAGTDGR